MIETKTFVSNELFILFDSVVDFYQLLVNKFFRFVDWNDRKLAVFMIVRIIQDVETSNSSRLVIDSLSRERTIAFTVIDVSFAFFDLLDSKLFVTITNKFEFLQELNFLVLLRASSNDVIIIDFDMRVNDSSELFSSRVILLKRR